MALLDTTVSFIIWKATWGDCPRFGLHRFPNSRKLRDSHYLKGLGGVALLEQLWLCLKKYVTGGEFWGFNCSCQAQNLSLPAACIAIAGCRILISHVGHHASCCEDNGLHFWNCTLAQSNAFIYELPWSWCLFTALTTSPSDGIRFGLLTGRVS